MIWTFGRKAFCCHSVTTTIRAFPSNLQKQRETKREVIYSVSSSLDKLEEDLFAEVATSLSILTLKSWKGLKAKRRTLVSAFPSHQWKGSWGRMKPAILSRVFVSYSSHLSATRPRAWAWGPFPAEGTMKNTPVLVLKTVTCTFHPGG